MEKRQALRTQYPCRLVIDHPIWGQYPAVSKDISNTGVFVRLESTVEPKIDVGAKLSLRVVTGLPQPKTIETQVVRAHNQGLGLKFIA